MGVSLLRCFPLGEQNQTELHSAAAPHTSLFLPVSRGTVLRADRWVQPEHSVLTWHSFCLILSLQFRQTWSSIYEWPCEVINALTCIFLQCFQSNVLILSFSTDYTKTFRFRKVTLVSHPPWQSLQGSWRCNFPVLGVTPEQDFRMMTPDIITPEEKAK